MPVTLYFSIPHLYFVALCRQCERDIMLRRTVNELQNSSARCCKLSGMEFVIHFNYLYFYLASKFFAIFINYGDK